MSAWKGKGYFIMFAQKARAALDLIVRRLSDIGAKLPASPWVTIWTRPRDIMRAILDGRPGRVVLLLAMLGGFADILDNAAYRNVGDRLSVPQILLVSAVVGPVAGVLILYIAGGLLAWTGRWIKGRAAARDVRAAIAWSNVPLIWGLLLWIPKLVLFGKEMFTRETPRLDDSIALSITFLLFAFAGLVLAVWTIVLFFKCLAEAQRFSAWKAVGNTFLAVLTVVIPAAVIAAVIDGIFR